jgi:hypothetical protein
MKSHDKKFTYSYSNFDLKSFFCIIKGLKSHGPRRGNVFRAEEVEIEGIVPLGCTKDEV